MLSFHTADEPLALVVVMIVGFFVFAAAVMFILVCVIGFLIYRGCTRPEISCPSLGWVGYGGGDGCGHGGDCGCD